MEYLILLFEYIFINRKSYLMHIILCSIIGFSIYNFANCEILIRQALDIYSNILTAIGILTGFSISIFTVFLTIDNPNIEKAKEENIGRKLYNSEISLYDSILISLAYVIIVQCVLLVCNFLYPIFIDLQSPKSKIFFSVDITLTIYIIILLMKCVLDFYFIITKKEK